MSRRQHALVLFTLLLSVLATHERAAAQQLDRFDQGRPHLIVGPIWGLRTPWMIVGGGATAILHLAPFFHLQATYMFGAGLVKGGDGGVGTHFFEAYAGVPVVSWVGRTAQSIVTDQWRFLNVEVTEYVNLSIPSHESIVAEVGVVSGESVFDRTRTDMMGGMTTVRTDPQLLNLAVGARYIYFWHVADGQSSIRNHTQFTAHVLFGPFGSNPDESGTRILNTGLIGSSEKGYSTRPVGFKLGFSGPVWANSFATLDFEFGYLPGGGDWFFALGNTFPIWII